MAARMNTLLQNSTLRESPEFAYKYWATVENKDHSFSGPYSRDRRLALPANFRLGWPSFAYKYQATGE